MNDFTSDSYALFEELAAEKYDFGACKSGEKMTFGKCQKVGGSGKNAEKVQRLNDMKATAERSLAVAKKNKGDSERGWLGVYIQDVTSDIKEAMDLESKRGVLVRDVVEDSPAEEAGIEQEDVIIEFSGQKVKDSSELTKLIRSSSPGEKASSVSAKGSLEK